MAVLYTFREPSLCRHEPREFMRNAVLDVTPIIPATACHQRNYIERYSRFLSEFVVGCSWHIYVCIRLNKGPLFSRDWRRNREKLLSFSASVYTLQTAI